MMAMIAMIDSDNIDKSYIGRMIANASDLEIEMVWLAKIIENQSDDEVERCRCIFTNRSGLNSRDAPIVTHCYNKVRSGEQLSKKQLSILRTILPKYWKQYRAKMKN